ncbi:MAG: DsbA family protein [Chloroflexi bacterium]|nr:DsbA family protein [Chloroflexota bacterium]
MAEEAERHGIRVTVFSDYLCPWCYVALVRLHRLKAECGARLELTWKNFPLRPYGIPTLSPGKLNHGMAAAEAEEEGIPFKQWPESLPPPASSIPALEAAKCAQLQGTQAFERYQLALFQAYFEQNQDISQTPVLFSLAREVQLDVDKFVTEFNSGRQKRVIWAEFDEARNTLHITSIPTAIFENGIRFECAVPIEVYRRAVELCRAPAA